LIPAAAVGALVRTAPAVEAPAAAGAPAATGPSFDQVLGQILNTAIDTVQNGEAAAVQGLQGAMGPMQVVEAVMSAQRTLQATLAIRDKAVAAYQEISRMAI
jgi:flagellar hook-basal body complex protein FliE